MGNLDDYREEHNVDSHPDPTDEALSNPFTDPVQLDRWMRLRDMRQKWQHMLRTFEEAGCLPEEKADMLRRVDEMRELMIQIDDYDGGKRQGLEEGIADAKMLVEKLTVMEPPNENPQ